VGVWFTATAWPDIAVGLAIALLFIKSSFTVLREAVAELRDNKVENLDA